MKADLSRSTFSRAKRYRDVRLQQGRVQLDADFNEYVDLAAHRVETETVDVVGRCGAPMHAAGFRLAATVAQLPVEQQAAATALGPLAPGDFFLSAGRFYAGGWLCESDAPCKLSGQAAGDLPGATPLAGTGVFLVYLDVWARHVTFIDDPALREVALGGPDTATRNRTIWQVRAVRVGDVGTPPDCSGEFAAYDAEIAAPTGRMAAEVDPTPDDPRPCVLPPGGGYRRLENQLYRVEIHAGGAAGGAATFKWSRDNGAIVSGFARTAQADTIELAHPPRDEVRGFEIGGWVELFDDTHVLRAQPGLLVRVIDLQGDRLRLAAPLPATGFDRNPQVRRWDGAGAVPLTAGAWISLEDGVRVRFAAGSFRSGDYWMVPARTATADVEWPRSGGAAEFLVPHGIAHRYCRLGFAEVTTAGVTVTNCAPLFPPLTELDLECDLRLHNKHLHGRGVVCGLQVHCAGEDRASVAIESGHAIDCEGTDILLPARRLFGAAARARELDLLDGNGNGRAQLTLVGDAQRRPVFDLRAVPAGKSGNLFQEILEGTLWMEFYEECLRPLVDYLRDTVFEDGGSEEESNALVPPGRRRQLALTNLIAHRTGTAPNRRLWLSRTEHDLLAEIYSGLQEYAGRSRTFCAIADTFGPFPSYPFDSFNIRTAFADRAIDQVKVLPGRNTAIGWGAAHPAQIFVFDLATAEMTREIALAGAAGAAVQDATFVLLGGQPTVVVATGTAAQTVLSFLDGNSFAAARAPVVLGGGLLRRLEPHPALPGRLVAVQPGQGVHLLGLDTLGSGALGAAHWRFNAAGHLAVSGFQVAATVAGSGAPAGGYVALRFGQLGPTTREVLDEADTPLARLGTSFASGEDGIVFAGTGAALRLHVAVNLPGAGGAKTLLLVDPASRSLAGTLPVPPADDGAAGTGPVRLGALGSSGVALHAVTRRNQAFRTLGTAAAAVTLQPAPAQWAPDAVHGDNQHAVIANRAARTLTVYPAAALTLSSPLPGDAAIGAYRDEVMAAFEGLIIPLLQGLKDCLCERLLRDCPECGEDEYEPLATIEFVGGQVHHICNFARREVLTFPKVKFWLSAVPILPLIEWAVSRFCCWVIPSPERRTDGRTSDATGSGVTLAPRAPELSIGGDLALGAVALLREGRAVPAFTAQLERTVLLAQHGLRSGVREWSAPAAAAPPEVRVSEVVGAPAQTAAAQLEQRGVVVTGVQPYEEALSGGAKPERYENLPATLRAGDRVQLFERAGEVVFYRRLEPARPVEGAPAGTVPPEVIREVVNLRGELEVLKVERTAEVAARDARLSELQHANEKWQREVAAKTTQLEREVQRLASAPPAPAPAPGVSEQQLQATVVTLRGELAAAQRQQAAEIAALKAAQEREIAALKTAQSREITAVHEKQAEELKARDQRLADLARVNERLRQEFEATTKSLRTDLDKLARQRPTG
jgi:hypothetical protein